MNFDIILGINTSFQVTFDHHTLIHPKGILFFHFPGKVRGPPTPSSSEIGGKRKYDFFFRSNFLIFTFFFLRKTLNCTHSFKIRGQKKKAAEKKVTFFTHSLELCQKVENNELFRGNKKKIRYRFPPFRIIKVFGGLPIQNQNLNPRLPNTGKTVKWTAWGLLSHSPSCNERHLLRGHLHIT